ncbi:hypothetical protein BV898_19973 [Hypsibius exemplaris]|uniref:Uncharacterized protein n=1 Tax=Hypsibius exemplaris TaxID=2072580 RepID=A0A9X6NRY3_HYPEX|nr:hypothetical protein BV898_19973 [Hypsibius exemplaris]
METSFSLEAFISSSSWGFEQRRAAKQENVMKDARALERQFLASPQVSNVTKNAKELVKKLLIDIGTTVEELKNKTLGKKPKGKGEKNDQPTPKSTNQQTFAAGLKAALKSTNQSIAAAKVYLVPAPTQGISYFNTSLDDGTTSTSNAL